MTGIGKGQWIQFSKTANGTTNPVQAYANVSKNKIFICKFIYNKELSHHYRKVKLFNSSLKYAFILVSSHPVKYSKQSKLFCFSICIYEK